MMAIADGKVYVTNGEHSPNQPMYRGYELYCVDANTGELLWKVDNYAQSPVIADGYLVTVNGYDMQEYCFGKGLSAVTVSAPMTAVPQGSSMIIQGTVTDQSPGQTSLGVPAAGTPAIADENMSAWMEYMYMQKPKPANTIGVPVTLVAIAEDGTSEIIGTVTSDESGTYGTAWTPSAKGVYKIVANFDGSDSYFSSWAETHVVIGDSSPIVPSAVDVAGEVVSQLPTPIPATPAPTMPTASDVANNVISQLPSVSATDMAIIAFLALVFIVGLVNLAMLRKKNQA